MVGLTPSVYETMVVTKVLESIPHYKTMEEADLNIGS